LDQALELRRLAAERRETQTAPAAVSGASSPRLRILAVTSGKGGVGKTNFTINFALALAERGERVAILDADLGMANVNVALGMAVRATVHDVVLGRRTLAEVAVDGPGGVKVIPGGSGVSELANLGHEGRTRLVEGLAEVGRFADVLLVDTAAGISANVLAFACAADTVIVVTVPEPPAIADAYGMMKALYHQRREADVRLVVNRCMRPFEGKAVFQKLDLVAQRFLGASLRHMGSIPDDEAVPACVRRQRPFLLEAPSAGSSKAVRKLAAEYLGEQGRGGGLGGFLERLARWFG
jgi:flagellar biosynthesis protein FlhG